jgi:Ni,Fe-hydrogenase III large subunit
MIFEVAKLPYFEVHAWRADVARRLGAGQRPVTLFGRREGDEVIITAVFQTETLEVTRTTAKASTGYSELTSSFGALHCFERELHEQTGLHFANHPWLKPIRFQGQDQAAMNAYPYYRIDGKEVHEVAVGPIHAGVIEPGSFRFMCMGEQVHHLEIQLGYQHRGLEPRLLGGDPRRLTPLVETIAGDTTIAHAWAFCAALEELAGCELDEDTGLARAFVLELERVAMHLAGLSGLAADVGFLQGASTYGRLRTTAINTTMRLCGSRFGRSALRPGGLGLKLPAELVDLVAKNVELLRTDLEIINELFVTSQTVRHRLEGVGVLAQAQAIELGVVGLAARASGVALDARRTGVWQRAPIASVVLKDGDCQARGQLRIAEMGESLAWLAGVLAKKPQFGGPKKPVGPLAPGQLVVSVVEGWRGEVVHCLETGPGGALVHAKVQDPSLRNWMGLAIAVRGNEISDFPICNKSFDLSYCGNDL